MLDSRIHIELLPDGRVCFTITTPDRKLDLALEAEEAKRLLRGVLATLDAIAFGVLKVEPMPEP